MSHSQSPRLPSIVLSPRVKVWLEIDGRYVFRLGIAEILQAIDQAGSIKQAAAALGKSYRHVWGRVKAAEEALGQPLVDTHVGGAGDRRSTLTPIARRHAAAFLRLRSRMKDLLDRECNRLFA
jgi:molybdate transport system regulatory protein